MSREVRLEKSVALAAATHAAAFAALALAIPASSVRVFRLPMPHVESAVEVSLDPEARRDSVLAPNTLAGEAAHLDGPPSRRLHVASAAVRERPGDEPPPTVRAPEAEAVVTSSEGASSSPWSFSATVGAANAGGAPSAGAVQAGTEGRGDRESPRAATGVGAMNSVRSALGAHDRRVGLAAGGALVQAASDLVYASRLPPEGHARIELRTDANGVVTSARVIDASAEMDAWNDLAEKLAAVTRAKPLRVPAGANGLAVTLRVDSSLRLPTGHRAGPVSVSVVHAPVRAGSGAHVNVSPLGAGIDTDPTDMLIDATSTARRVVGVTVASEERL